MLGLRYLCPTSDEDVYAWPVVPPSCQQRREEDCAGPEVAVPPAEENRGDESNLKTSRPVGMNETIGCPSPSDSLPQEPKWNCLALPLRITRIEDEKKRQQVKSKGESA